jgi:hypothetical protein
MLPAKIAFIIQAGRQSWTSAQYMYSTRNCEAGERFLRADTGSGYNAVWTIQPLECEEIGIFFSASEQKT